MARVIKKIKQLRPGDSEVLSKIQSEVVDLIKSHSSEDANKCLYVLLRNCEQGLDSKLVLIEQHFESLKTQPEVLFDEIERILNEFEEDENIVAMVLQTKLRKLISGDSFKLQKEFILELEQASNLSSNINKFPQASAEAKALIIESMFSQDQSSIAMNYLKKNLIKNGANPRYQSSIVQALLGLQVDLDLLRKDKFIANIIGEDNLIN